METNNEYNVEKIYDTFAKISSEKKIFDLLPLVAKETADLIGCEKTSIFLLDSSENELWSIATIDGSKIKFDARLGIAGEVVTTGKTIRVNDISRNKNFYSGIDKQTGFKTKKIIVVPLYNRAGEISGTFQALNKKGGNFTKSDEELLEAVARQISVTIDNAQEFEDLTLTKEKLINENTRLIKELRKNFSTRMILGNSPPIQGIIRIIQQISDVNVDVLISGESGTGKELIAKAIHYSGNLSERPFVSINCAAIPENLFESELFGIEKGIATGVEKRVGKFELANGGTLFLDEIGELNLSCQAKILRVLQERVIERVGGNENIDVNVRVIAATNRDLEQETVSGKFRNDLYFRLKVVHITTPPLKTISDDIPILAQTFMERICNELDKPSKKFSKSAITALKNYSWPGNMRELENEVKRLSVLCSNKTVQKEDLSDNIRLYRTLETKSKGNTLKAAVEELEKSMIIEALSSQNNNKAQTADFLGLSRWGLIKKMKRYGID